MAKGQKLEIQLPDPEPQPPSIHPDVADLRERMASAEARLATAGTESPIAGEALRLAGEAHQLASQALAAASTSTEPPANPESVIAVDRVTEPPPLENPISDAIQTLETETPAPIRPWWHPLRLL